MKHVGIFGGSFNPIHWGHIRLSEWIVRQGKADEVWLMVSPRNPLKKDADLLDERERLHMARLAVADADRIRVSDFEFGLPRPSYTWQTLRALRSAWADTDFSLIIGADNWLHFSNWAHPAEILAHHRLLVYPRPGYPLPQSTPPDGVEYLDAPVYDVDSTRIRRLLKHGGDVSDYLPPAVVHHIEERRLYA